MRESFPRLGEVREQRAGLRSAMHHLEDAAAAPVAGRSDAWNAALASSLDEVRAGWDRHVSVTEGPDGLFEQIQNDAPQLAPRIQQLHREHDELNAALVSVAGGRPPDADGVRERIIDLVAMLARHRQRGADLIYEAYSVDVGGAG